MALEVDMYLRLSKDPTGLSVGVDRQERECRDLCKRNGWIVRNVYTDNDLSATSGVERPGFEALLRATPEAIVTWHQDRLLRLTSDLERVINLNVPVYTVVAGNLDLTNPAGRAVARTIAAWSQYETEQKALRQRSANLDRALRGEPRWATRPFGFEKDGTLRESEAALIRQASADVLDGKTPWMVARDWTAAGVRTPFGGKWTSPSVTKLLTRPSNAALVSYHREILEGVKGNWTPIVDEATVRALRSLLLRSDGKKGKRRVRSSLLSGIGTCGKCGATLCCAVQQWNGKRVRAYTCSVGGHLARKADTIEDAVLRATFRVLALGIPLGLLSEHSEDDSVDVQALHTERAALLHRRDVELSEALAAGILTPVQVQAATKTIDERLVIINAELAMTQRSTVFDDLFLTWKEERDFLNKWFGELPLHKQQNILTSLWDSMVLPANPKDGPVHLQASKLTRQVMDAQNGVQDAWEWVWS